MSNNPLNLDEAAEWAGLWWLPDGHGERISGILRYDPEDGLALELVGAFEDRITSNPAPGKTVCHEGIRTWDVIYGAAQQREITLLGCVPTSGMRARSARVMSPDRQTVRATTAIIGAHVGGEEDTVFSAAELSVEDLGRWAASSVFEASYGAPEGKLDGTGSITVKPVEAQTVVVEGTEYRLSHTHTLPFFDQRKGGATARMRETVSVRVTPAEPFSFSAALEAASMVQDLIALAMHRAAGVIWLQLEVAGTESVLPDGRLMPCRRADVLYPFAALGKHDAKAIDHHQVLFTCELLPFEEVVPRWCEAHNRLQAATNMILGLRYAPARFIENNLLTAVGAAEALHRGLGVDEKPFPKEEFSAMRDAMLGQIPEEHRSRFKAAIRNDPTLRERLHDLAKRPDEKAIALLVPDVAHWAKRTARARNDLAHEGRAQSHSFEELIAIVEVTTAIVILNLLYELGLTPERQRMIVQENPQLRATAQTSRDWLRAPGFDS
ncbi:HEPN domain-containing protein [Helcobacillus massiliensis]|uniref:ApeA N-terminal domain-containing protein n=1 Tax=Helcobacillus massiliensis TaxID=521392 RepID=A0A839QVG1_9MICO|nr:HEPN domain-containing protein [Helcobacillus massiliensis]MBB3022839.1 hypothetical protein [Helcobacillus massiliensis]